MENCLVKETIVTEEYGEDGKVMKRTTVEKEYKCDKLYYRPWYPSTGAKPIYLDQNKITCAVDQCNTDSKYATKTWVTKNFVYK